MAVGYCVISLNDDQHTHYPVGGCKGQCSLVVDIQAPQAIMMAVPLRLHLGTALKGNIHTLKRATARICASDMVNVHEGSTMM